MQAINLENFLYQKLEQSSVYLAYPTLFRNSISFIDLIGTRNKIDLHNLSVTKQSLSSIIKVFSSVVTHGGSIWVVAPGNRSLLSRLNFEQLQLASRYFVLWVKGWIPGQFTNKAAFQKIRWMYRYPSVLFYPSYSFATQSLADGRGGKVLQLGVADSNSDRQAYAHTIPANEKSPSSNALFAKIALRVVLNRIIVLKSNFFNKKIKNNDNSYE